jgi:hypothetical protein
LPVSLHTAGRPRLTHDKPQKSPQPGEGRHVAPRAMTNSPR